MPSRRTTLMIVLAAALIAGLAFAVPAFAYDEPNGSPEDHHATDGSVQVCTPCHVAGPSGRFCAICHAPHGGQDEASRKGPHGLYSATTNRCASCHAIHEAGGPKLLPAATVTGSCFTCHDGTGGRGVYQTLSARGESVGSSHSIDATNVVPGGDGATGGPATMAFKGLDGNLGCGDCHSPHDQNTVAPYVSDRHRTSFVTWQDRASTHLLRRNPGGSTATATVYGSDWCLGCHAGRASGGAPHNHPVDSHLTTATPFNYSWVALLDSDGPTSGTTTGAMAFSNRGFLMPLPRTADQEGHAPICQQCHSNSRYVGELSDQAIAAPYSIVSTDGQDPADNPRFQNFPHEAANPNLLVETADDLCLNCHDAARLP